MEVWAVILAAGAGSRFGGEKMLADFNGQPLIAAVCGRVLSAQIAGVLVVTGEDGHAVEMALAGYRSLSLVTNPEWRTGLASSLKAGVGALPATADACALFLGDMPDIPLSVIDSVVQELRAGAEAVVVECDGSPGHPVGISRALFGLMQTATGDRGARPLLADCDAAVVVKTNDRGAIFDIDTQEDLADGAPGAQASNPRLSR